MIHLRKTWKQFFFLRKELMLEERLENIFHDDSELVKLIEQVIDLDQGNLGIKNSIKINPKI